MRDWLDDWCLADIQRKLDWYHRFMEYGVMPMGGGGDDQPDEFWQAVNVLSMVEERIRLETDVKVDKRNAPRLRDVTHG